MSRTAPLVALALLLLVVAPVAWAALRHGPGAARAHWGAARWDSAGLAPDPGIEPGAVVQVYAARAWGWKGAVAVHSWLALKPPDARAYERYDVVGWGAGAGRPAVRRDLRPVPDGHWAGNLPELVVELRGPAAEAAIPPVRAAIAAYPHRDLYVTWPGPNSNSFVAHVLRSVPGLRAELPPLAIGKDFLPNGRLVARAPSGTGFQVSLLGLAGFTVAAAEGIEANLLGLVVGIDPGDLALKLPGVGRLSLRGRRPAPTTG